MLKISQTRSFNVGMKFGLFLCFFIITIKCFSQEKSVTGIVFDKESKARIASVNIRNPRNGLSVYNNLKGEFKINAQQGDHLVFLRQEYRPDTIKVADSSSLAIYMTRLAIQLKEVSVHDTLLSPEKRLEATKEDFTKIYGSLAYRDFLSTPSSGGAGLSIDALYNSLSRSGKNAERLRQIIESDYHQNVIDYRFNRTFVGNITGLKDERLTAFMLRYRPGYYTIITASEYEFISMIRANLKRFLRNPRTYYLQPLKSK
jgi:hypothetical protein